MSAVELLGPKINVKNFDHFVFTNTEIPPFIPEQKISNKEWEYIKSDIHKLRNNSDFENSASTLLQICTVIKTVLPNRYLDLKISDLDFVKLKNWLENTSNEYDWLRVANLKILFSEKFNEVKIDNYRIQQLTNGLSDINNEVKIYKGDLFALKILYPDEFEKVVANKTTLTSANNLFNSDNNSYLFAPDAYLKSLVKIAFPNINTNFTKNNYLDLLSQLKSYNDKNDYIDKLFCMQTLAVFTCKDIQVDNGKINLLYNSFSIKNSALPFERSFA